MGSGSGARHDGAGKGRRGTKRRGKGGRAARRGRTHAYGQGPAWLRWFPELWNRCCGERRSTWARRRRRRATPIPIGVARTNRRSRVAPSPNGLCHPSPTPSRGHRKRWTRSPNLRLGVNDHASSGGQAPQASWLSAICLNRHSWSQMHHASRSSPWFFRFMQQPTGRLLAYGAIDHHRTPTRRANQPIGQL